MGSVYIYECDGMDRAASHVVTHPTASSAGRNLMQH